MSLKITKIVIITTQGMECVHILFYNPKTEHEIMAQVKLTSLNNSGGKPVASNVMNGAGTLSPYSF